MNRRHSSASLIAIVLFFAISVQVSAQYSAQRDGDVVRLADSQHQTSVAILPSLGNLVFEMKVKGQDIIHHSPFASIQAFKEHHSSSGIPVLAPWANRLDELAFYANGKKYIFNMNLGNVHAEMGALPIHGLVGQATSWEIVEVKSDTNAAWVTSRLDFYKHPDWMAQFPFAHTIQITQRLHDGVLEVRTKLENLSTDPMPVSIGFHPYFQLTDSGRDDWTISVAAKTHYLLQPNKIPTGETEPITAKFKDPATAQLRDYDLDDVFGDLLRDSQGRASFTVAGKRQRVTVQLGPKFLTAVIYAPKPKNAEPQAASTRLPERPPQGDSNFICFEPMAAITDAVNLNQAGKYPKLQSIAPGGTWEESFWIVPSEF
jgi:aldose 1-epimerase